MRNKCLKIETLTLYFTVRLFSKQLSYERDIYTSPCDEAITASKMILLYIICFLFRPASSMKLQEINMDTITEQKAEENVEYKEKIPDNLTFKKMERRSERQRVKRQIFVNGQSEINENAANDKIELKRKSKSPRRIMTSDYSSEDGDREDHASRASSAYEIYKKAGEWWK